MPKQRTLVLIADSDKAVRDALRFVLRLEGFRVHVHCGGAPLLLDPELERAHCVVLDECLKQMDGFAVLDRLRARNLSLPSILLTGHATTGLRARAERAGVHHVLEKPLLDDALLESLRRLPGRPGT